MGYQQGSIRFRLALAHRLKGSPTEGERRLHGHGYNVEALLTAEPRRMHLDRAEGDANAWCSLFLDRRIVLPDGDPLVDKLMGIGQRVLVLPRPMFVGGYMAALARYISAELAREVSPMEILRIRISEDGGPWVEWWPESRKG